MNDLRDTLATALHETADLRGSAVVGTLTDGTVLLESGLDSLGFAILVSRLEEDLGYDPFVMMDVPVYPQTFGEFVDIYRRHAPR